MSRSQNFDQILLECIDEAFSVLGSEPKQALYQYLITMRALDRERIPDKIEEFSAGLKEALGSASKVIEHLILKSLFQRLGSTLKESSGLDFLDYVTEAKRRFEISSAKHSDALDSGRSKKGQLPG